MKAWFESEFDDEVTYMREISQEDMDRERVWYFDDVPEGEPTEGVSTYRKEAEDCVSLPCQISTTYV